MNIFNFLLTIVLFKEEKMGKWLVRKNGVQPKMTQRINIQNTNKEILQINKKVINQQNDGKGIWTNKPEE